jgi:hypothetical protein
VQVQYDVVMRRRQLFGYPSVRAADDAAAAAEAAAFLAFLHEA